MKTKWGAAAALAAIGAIVACSANNGAGGGQYDSCLSSFLGSSCISCLESNCGGAVGDLETGCGDYFGCICPGGNFSAPNAQSQTCGSKLEESSCVSTQGNGSAATCTACQSACGSIGGSSSSVGGDSAGSTSGSNSGSSSGCGGSPLPGTQAVTLSLTGVDLGDVSMSDWRSIGWNLDGKCTTASSTDSCTLAAGAPTSARDDGSGGIDNSFGENLCPILNAVGGTGACSNRIEEAYLQTDASGTGTLVLSIGPATFFYPVHDVQITLSESGGMAGGVIPTAGLAAALQSAAGCVSTSLCNASALQEFQTEAEQASDIGADGSNAAGAACDGVSFGIKFTGSMAVASLPSPATCPCP